MLSFVALVKDTGTNQVFRAEAEANTMAEAVEELKDWHACELDTLPTYITIEQITIQSI